MRTLLEKLFDKFKVYHLPEASTLAPGFEFVYDLIYWFSIATFAAIAGATIYFMWRYRRSRVHPEKTTYLTGHTPTELGVAIFLFISVMIMFYLGWVNYQKHITTPPNSIEINVVGKQWLWEFEYTNGRKMVNEIIVPKGKPVKLLMTSSDVIHSFFVPNFRIKQDVVPGAYTTVWFNATQVGENIVYCAEYCGTAHSKMLAKVKVLEPKDYERWQVTWELEQKLGIPIGKVEAAEKPTEVALTQPDTGVTEEKPEEKPEEKAEEPVSSTAERGKKVFAEKGCTACHSTTGAVLVGPPVNGVFGHDVELKDGSKAHVDENYLRESIMNPQAKLVKGFQPLMPTYKGTLTDDEVNALVAYIKSLSK